MTKKEALTIALNTVENKEAIEVLTKMLEQVSKTHSMSDEKKAERKAKTASARAELVAKVAQIGRAHV